MHDALLVHVVHAFQNLEDKLGRFLLIQRVLLGNIMKQFTSTNSRGRERDDGRHAAQPVERTIQAPV